MPAGDGGMTETDPRGVLAPAQPDAKRIRVAAATSAFPRCVGPTFTRPT